MDSQKLAIPFDISENLRRQVLKLCRLSALGRLSSAISHDTSNALTVISGNAQIIQLNIDNLDHNELLAWSDEILDQVERIQKTTRLAGSFSTRLTETIEEINPADSIKRSIFAIKRLCALHNIEIVFNPYIDLNTIRYDATILDFILLELCFYFLSEKYSKNQIVFKLEDTKDVLKIKISLLIKHRQNEEKYNFEKDTIQSDLLNVLIVLDSYGGHININKESNALTFELTIPRSKKALLLHVSGC